MHYLLRVGLREIDAMECTASGHHDVRTALIKSVLQSDPHVFTILADGEPVAIFGVAGSEHDHLVGHPWLLATDTILTVVRDFLFQAPLWIEFLQRIYPRLENIVSVENAASVRWLPRVGFELGEEVDVNGTTFRRFTRV